MRTFPIVRAVAVLVFIVGVASSGLAMAGSQTAPDKVSAMIDTIFADVPTGDQRVVVFKDDRERAYLAFYVSTYADVKELRAYSITFRNTREYVDEAGAIDASIDSGDYAAAFDSLISVMRLDLGSKYASDVGLDGVHEGDVAVGAGHMRDRFHRRPIPPTCTGSREPWPCRGVEGRPQTIDLASAAAASRGRPLPCRGRSRPSVPGFVCPRRAPARMPVQTWWRTRRAYAWARGTAGSGCVRGGAS